MASAALKAAISHTMNRGLVASTSTSLGQGRLLLSGTREYHATPTTLQKQKEDITDRTRINTDSTEYSLSGGDDAGAHSQAAFEPDQNDPKTQQKRSEKMDSSDPLTVSPANHDVSQPHDSSKEGRTEFSAAKGTREKSSGGGSAPKAGKVS